MFCELATGDGPGTTLGRFVARVYDLGTAFTDDNDAISYHWAVAEVDDLIISNLDDGRVNPAFPKNYSLGTAPRQAAKCRLPTLRKIQTLRG